MKWVYLTVFYLFGFSILTACSGDSKEARREDDSGSTGVNSLVALMELPETNSRCYGGGVLFAEGPDINRNGVLDDTEIHSKTYQCKLVSRDSPWNFNRIASFPVCSQLHTHCDTDTETSAEILAVSSDNNTLIYSDSPGEAIGFIDIKTPEYPAAAGVLAMGGEPTSVAVAGRYALVAVNTSPKGNYIDVSGVLNIVDIASQSVVHSIDLGGQPDSIAVSPDGQYAAVVIENERNEDLGTGLPPQLPAGFLVIVTLADTEPANWSSSVVSLTGVADLFADDPEPEYVDINEDNIAVVTLQENNHIVLVNLAEGSIINDFSAGTVDLTFIDTVEQQPALINQVDSLNQVPREPDGVAWINTAYFATADEGDMNGGGRGFSIFNTHGQVVWSSGSDLDHIAARYGHYPDARSGNKGNEPENIEVGTFGGNRYLFVNSERSSLVFVYDVADPENPIFRQVLPAAQAPEGGLAIASRNLLAVASERDSRDEKVRSAVNLYQYNAWPTQYPTIASVSRGDSTPVPWGALSGLSADPWHDNLLYAVEDSYYGSSRIFTIDLNTHPALIVREQKIVDSFNKFAALNTGFPHPSATRFDDADKAAMINSDGTLNLDAEGIARASDGGFWLVSEGRGTVSESASRPVESLNFLFKLSLDAKIENVFLLPDVVNSRQIRFGFEGVTEHQGKVYVVFQRAWEGEEHPRIGIFNPLTSEWEFLFYPLDSPSSPRGGWVGLSEIVAADNGRLLVLERDNQAGADAAIKRIYSFDPSAHVDGEVVAKTLVRDLMQTGDLTPSGAVVAEKVEGMAMLPGGDVFIVNDNDGVDGSNGETQLINLGHIL